MRRFLAVTLLLSMLFVTMPVSAAELAGTRTTLGSVSGSGVVSLRGVSMLQEGTIFDGDTLEVGSKGYARVMFVAGHRLELDSSTRISIRQTEENLSVQVNSGNVAFTRADNAALLITAGPYEIRPVRGGSGSVALVGKESVGLRSIKGTLAVRQTTSKITYSLGQGEERILMFSGQSTQPLAQVASTLPTPLPEVPPLPQTTTPAGKGLTRGGWITVLATVGGAAGAIAVLATRGNGNDNVTQAKQREVQGTQAAVTTAQQAQTTAQQVVSAAATVNTALNSVNNTSTRSALQAQVATISNQATAAQNQIGNILSQLNTLFSRLQNSSSQNDLNSIASQINTLISQLNTQIGIVNDLITQLQNIANAGTQAGGTIPPVVIQPAPTAGTVFSSPVTPTK